MATEAQTAVRDAATLVAQAITKLAALGPDLPSSARESLNALGSAYAQLGWADPSVPYGLRERDY